MWVFPEFVVNLVFVCCGGNTNLEIGVFEPFFKTISVCDLWITPKFFKLVFQLVKLKLGGGKAVNEFISSNLKVVLFYGW